MLAPAPTAGAVAGGKLALATMCSAKASSSGVKVPKAVDASSVANSVDGPADDNVDWFSLRAWTSTSPPMASGSTTDPSTGGAWPRRRTSPRTSSSSLPTRARRSTFSFSRASRRTEPSSTGDGGLTEVGGGVGSRLEVVLGGSRAPVPVTVVVVVADGSGGADEDDGTELPFSATASWASSSATRTSSSCW